MNTFVILLIFTLSSIVGYCLPPRNSELSKENYREWIEYIRPSDKEETWRTISWRNKFMPAVEEAKKLDRPILLWAMNGNPCGET